jgi:hypothetical protein
MTTPIQYLDKAMTRLRDLGLVPEKTAEAPIVALLNRVADLDEDKVVAIARTLSQSSLFNQVVREQIAAMELGERYAKVTEAFNSIRDDAKSMIEQIEDGRIDTSLSPWLSRSSPHTEISRVSPSFSVYAVSARAGCTEMQPSTAARAPVIKIFSQDSAAHMRRKKTEAAWLETQK